MIHKLIDIELVASCPLRASRFIEVGGSPHHKIVYTQGLKIDDGFGGKFCVIKQIDMNIRIADAEIYLVGLGMFGLQQLTIEAFEILKNAKCVYHLSGMQEQLQEINPNTHDLDNLYSRPGKRVDIYEDLAHHIVNSACNTRPIVFDFQDLMRWVAENFTDDAEWREMPKRIELCEGISIDLS
jgi:hypothetical protein